MQTVGIIAEWSPFHLGHVYCLNEARRLSQAQVVVAVMSGNYTQRGQVAILDKWTRASIAVQNGADIVVELPPWWALQPADRFSFGGIKILQALGVKRLAFGVESSSCFADTQAFAKWLGSHSDQVEAAWARFRSANKSQPYAQVRLAFYQECLKIEPELAGLKIDFDQGANHLLAFLYCYFGYQLLADFTAYPINRLGAKHEATGPLDPKETYASGSQLRSQLLAGFPPEHLAPYLPLATQKALISNRHFPDLSNAWPVLAYLLLSRDAASLEETYLFEGGLAHRLQKIAKTAKNYEQFLNQTQTRVWPKSRLERALLMLLLNISDEENLSYQKGEQPVRLLAMTENGRRYLKDLEAVNLISRWDKKCSKKWPLQVRVDDIYERLFAGRPGSQILGVPFYYIDA